MLEHSRLEWINHKHGCICSADFLLTIRNTGFSTNQFILGLTLWYCWLACISTFYISHDSCTWQHRFCWRWLGTNMAASGWDNECSNKSDPNKFRHKNDRVVSSYNVANQLLSHCELNHRAVNLQPVKPELVLVSKTNIQLHEEIECLVRPKLINHGLDRFPAGTGDRSTLNYKPGIFKPLVSNSIRSRMVAVDLS